MCIHVNPSHKGAPTESIQVGEDISGHSPYRLMLGSLSIMNTHTSVSYACVRSAHISNKYTLDSDCTCRTDRWHCSRAVCTGGAYLPPSLTFARACACSSPQSDKLHKHILLTIIISSRNRALLLRSLCVLGFSGNGVSGWGERFLIKSRILSIVSKEFRLLALEII